MGKLLEAFGLDYRLMLINLFNFGILLFILYKVGYKPMMNFIQERTETIRKGLQNAEKAQSILENAKTEQQKLLASAKLEQRKLLEEASVEGSRQMREIVDHAKAEAEKMLTKARKDIDVEREQAMGEVKSEMAQLVIQIAEKVLSQQVDLKVDEKYLQHTLSTLK